MVDHLTRLANEAADRVENGYYSNPRLVSRSKHSLRQAITSCAEKNPIISEVKYASPSQGKIRSFDPVSQVAREMVAGGACALSVLTAPGSFAGDITSLAVVSRCVEVPVLMKDIIVSPVQMQAGARMGADAVLLIAELFENGLSEYSINRMCAEARKLGLELLIEACSPEEFSTLRNYKPDLYGVNNRNLSNLRVNLETTIATLTANGKPENSPLVSESGIETQADIQLLRQAGADAFLIGTAIMKSENIQEKVREMVNA